MKFEPTKLTKIIEQNYTHLMPDFLEMQTNYLATMNINYKDLDAALIAMVLTSQLYKNTLKENNSIEKISLKYFYQKENFKLPVSYFKIEKISSMINLPRETVRRKKAKLVKDKLIILDKKKNFYSLNTDLIEQNIIELQINNLSKFLSNFSLFFSQNRFFIKDTSKEKIKKDIEEKFLIYLIKFLDFQISYFSKMKTLIDIESIFVLLLCNLNTLTQIKNKQKIISSNIGIDKQFSNNNVLGLNATSISEITKVPRSTVLRKISNLEKIGTIKRDKFKRYVATDLNGINVSEKILTVMDYNIKLLGFFFSECFETYSRKS